jgi:hypothetical protein
MSTPKAFASFSPGLLQPWDKDAKDSENAESVGKCAANSFRVRDLKDRPFPRVEATLGFN